MSALHGYLKDIKIKSYNINLYDRVSKIKLSADTWLKGLDKNGISHSGRLETHLDSLTTHLRDKHSITPEEAFVLLCATYMHDIGYCHNGRKNSEGHAKRSQEMILKNPEYYHFNDFPRFNEESYPRIAEAVGLVCYGHDSRVSLEEIPHEFPDQCFDCEILNLRKLTALLRLADEADDSYIRQNPSIPSSKRQKIPLVHIGEETIVLHRDPMKKIDPREYQELVDEKMQILMPANNYLKSIHIGYWYVVLYPPVQRASSLFGYQSKTLCVGEPEIFKEGKTAPFMAEIPVDNFVGRLNDLENLHKLIKENHIVGIVGIEEIDKTALARIYAQRYRAEYPGGVYWASLKDSTWEEEAEKILAIAPIGSPVSFSDKQKLVQYVSDTVLARQDALLIIDNVDRANDILKPGCFVVVTTRDIKNFGDMPSHAIFNLPSLTETDAQILVTTGLGELRVISDPQGATRLLEVLDRVPLAVEIAINYLKDVPNLSFSTYIDKIQKTVEKMNINENEPTTHAPKKILASMELYLDQLKCLPNGDQLVSLLEGATLCSTSGFTISTLVAVVGLDGQKTSEVNDLVENLQRRSLLEYSNELNRYNIHPLLKRVAEKRLNKNPERKITFTNNLCTYFLHFAKKHRDDPEALIREKDEIWHALVQSGTLRDVNES